MQKEIMIFLAQIIGGLAVSIWIISIQNIRKKDVLLFQGVANFLYSIEYFILGAYTASGMNLVSTLRCFLFRNMKEDAANKLSYVFAFIILLVGVFAYDGYLSMIPIIVTIFYTLSSSKNNLKCNRIAVLISAFIWIYYNYVVGAYITILGNILEIISGVMALKRFRDVHYFEKLN